MPSFVVLIAATFALGGLLTAALVSRERQSRLATASGADDADAVGLDILARDGAAAAPSPAVVPAPTEAPPRRPHRPSHRADVPEPSIPAGDVWDSLQALDTLGAPATDDGAQRLGHPGEEVVATSPLGAPETPRRPEATAYADLARDLAADGRTLEAVLAQWADDLRRLGPELAGREPALVSALLTAPGAGTPVDGHARARETALALCAPDGTDGTDGTDGAAGPTGSSCMTLAPAPYLGEPAVAADPVTPAPVGHDEPAALRERAVSGTARALSLVEADPVGARQAAWEADLAAFDAVLLDSARRAGDVRLASVRLRRSLALARLRDARDPDDLVATTPDTLPDAVTQVRSVLAGVLEPHERPRLHEHLGAWPAA